MRKLIKGIVEFREQMLPQYQERFRELALTQKPDALFITCSDSRVVPDLLASTDPGDLFTMRNVGNLIPPATLDGASTGDLSEASAIEYAVLALKVANIVVCGHSGCGAMKAMLTRRRASRLFESGARRGLYRGHRRDDRLLRPGRGGQESDRREARMTMRRDAGDPTCDAAVTDTGRPWRPGLPAAAARRGGSARGR